MARALPRTTRRESLTEREVEAWLGLLYAHSALVKQVDDELIAAHRLPLSAHEILLKLRRSEEGQLSISKLAASVRVSTSRVSRLVYELEGRGFVERRSCATDARISYIAITDEGSSFIDAADATLHATVRRNFVDRLGASDIERLAAIWQKLNERVESCEI